ncbi:MAG: LytR C-terminal domain-containing protein [Actinomycetota bacterium]
MRRPGHAAEDGSFGKSAGMAAGRGALLLTVAVVLGIVLLNAADDPPPDRVTASSPDDDSSQTSTTLAAPTTTVATVPLRPPPEVKVLAANGTTTKGVARKVTDQLKGAGYNVLSPTDSQQAGTSAVYFTGDYEREAATVAEALGLPTTVVAALPNPPPLTDARGANVIVVVGPELAQRVSGTTATTAAAGAGATTSTTKAPVTTTRP